MVVGTLARAAAALDAVLVHYSTDFVFAGTASTPYTETDTPEPRSVYAQSKLIGEWLAADAPKHYVLRVESLFGGPHRRSSIDRIVDLVRSGQPAPVFVDRVVSPSFVADVADASAFILRAQPPTGVYHCVNSGHATWLAVGQEIVKRLGGSETALKPISVNDVKLRAARPQFAALDNAKLARAGYAMPSWQDASGAISAAIMTQDRGRVAIVRAQRHAPRRAVGAIFRRHVHRIAGGARRRRARRAPARPRSRDRRTRAGRRCDSRRRCRS